MADTAFAALIETVRMAGEHTPLHVPEDWMQGRTVYGGLVAAMALTAMRRHVPEDRKIRSLSITFVGPLMSGPFMIQTHLLRSGKYVSTIEAKIIQNDAVCSAAVGSFGGDRDSVIRMAPDLRPRMPDPSKGEALPFIEGLIPTFTRHFDYRWTTGEWPFSGKGGRELGGWINFREETDCLTEEWLIALADAWPTPVLSTLDRFAAASTLTWGLGFVHLDRHTCSENEWWQYHCSIDSAERGYAQERSVLWDPESRMALVARQTITVFA